MSVFQNPEGLVLEEEDETALEVAASHICNLRYIGQTAEAQLAMARFAAGLLPAEVLTRLKRARDGHTVRTKHGQNGSRPAGDLRLIRAR